MCQNLNNMRKINKKTCLFRKNELLSKELKYCDCEVLTTKLK